SASCRSILVLCPSHKMNSAEKFSASATSAAGLMPDLDAVDTCMEEIQLRIVDSGVHVQHPQRGVEDIVVRELLPTARRQAGAVDIEAAPESVRQPEHH